MARAKTVVVVSKPQHIDALRKTWRKSAEHKAAQVKRFFSALGAVLIAQLVGDFASGRDPLTHFTDLRTAWYYLLPFALVAWRQLHPAMTASQVDSAPGATIVPSEVDPGVVPDPAPDPAPDNVAPEGDAAP